MYKFVDTNEVSESALLPSEALKINGKFIEDLIPGYRTLSVSGREALSPELSIYETGARDGSMFKSKRYPARTIVVQYHLIAESCEAFRAAFNELASILDVKDAELIFNDEKDKYFIGTPSGIGEIEPGRNAVIGEFEILCLDPFKYSTVEYIAEAIETDDGGRMFVVNYNGTYKSFPKFETEFYRESEVADDGVTETPLTENGECGFVAFFNEDEKIIQIGDPDEVDSEEYSEAQMLVSQSFEKETSWGTATQNLWALNSGLTSSVTQAGTLHEVNTPIHYADKTHEWYLTPDSYGSGTSWHGPSITRTIPADASGEEGASNFHFRYTQKMSIGSGTDAQKERGAFQVLLVNGSGSSRKIVAGVNVFKSSVGKTANLRFYVNGKAVFTREIDLSYYNEFFGNNRVADKSRNISAIVTGKTSSIEKSGYMVKFNIGGKYGFNFCCGDDGFADLKVNEITFTFSQYGTNPALSYNGLVYTKFVKNNCETWKEVPNKFGSNDVLSADCRTGEIMLNNVPSPELGALGNDWEDFYLKKGLNQISVAYSDWVSGVYVPNFKMRFREVFL